MNQPPPDPSTAAAPANVSKRPPSAGAPRTVFVRELRRARLKNAVEPEINFLNITAMMDMMTIILVFLLKSMSQSSASIPQSPDLQIPKSVLQTEASQEGLAVLISKTSLVVDDNVVAPIPSDATHGVEAKFKRSGSPNDLYIVPLANALQSWREKDRAIRQATGKDPNFSEAIIIADQNVPFRLLTEILFTLGQCEFAKFHLMVMQGSKG